MYCVHMHIQRGFDELLGLGFMGCVAIVCVWWIDEMYLYRMHG
jgi:hypothetical protein